MEWGASASVVSNDMPPVPRKASRSPASIGTNETAVMVTPTAGTLKRTPRDGRSGPERGRRAAHAPRPGNREPTRELTFLGRACVGQ